MKKVGVIVAFLVLCLSITGLTSASIYYYNSSLPSGYFGGQNVNGKITISLSNASAKSIISSNFYGGIDLLDFLNANGLSNGNNYFCSSLTCQDDYAGDSTINSFILTSSANQTFGFKIQDSDVSVSDINFSITSDAPSACGSQIKLRFLGRDDLYIQNYNYRTTPCSGFYSGCFNSSLSSDSYTLSEISSNPYCELVHIPAGPAYYIGGNIINTTTNTAGIQMQMFDKDWNYLSACTLPALAQQTQSIGCIVNYSSANEGDFFVCVSAGANSNYMIRTERSGNKCGSSVNSYTYQRDYDLFAQVLPFDSVNIAVNENTFNRFNLDLNQEINDYLSTHYGNNCTVGCTIPFEISGTQQNVNIASPHLRYVSDQTTFNTNSIYSFSKHYATISMPQTILDLSYANLTIPLTSTQNRMLLYLDGSSFASIPVDITPGFTFGLSPGFALPGIATNFTIRGLDNVSSALWDFGDNHTAQGYSSSIVHTYANSGNYSISVQVTTNSGNSRKSFSILVGNPQQSAQQLSQNYDARMGNITQQLNAYPSWAVETLKTKVLLSDLQSQLAKIKSDLAVATTDAQYGNVVTEFLALNMPYSVSSSSSGTLPITLYEDKIDPSYILSLAGQNGTGNPDEIKKAIANWMPLHYNADVQFKQIKSVSDGENTPVATLVSISLSPMGNAGNAYLIINYPIGAIKFASSYSEKSVNSGTYIALSNSPQRIEFLVPGVVEISDLGMYISPQVSELNVISPIEPAANNGFNTSLFFLLLGILIVITIMVYILLQEWYKRNYEVSLFKNRDELYNIVNFIYNARASGLQDSDIRKKLSKSGWSGEKIDYAFRKIDGKRTGMFEIPLFKSRENRIVHQEIAKRQNGMVDTRFIKRDGSQQI